jgi:lipoyl(octanoyl) transferase
MEKQEIYFKDLGLLGYQEAWDYQEKLLRENVRIKSSVFAVEPASEGEEMNLKLANAAGTKNYLLFVEHPPVYTLGKSGKMENILLDDEKLKERGIGFFKTNRGGDITFHGPGQLVGYPILDLEKFGTDIGKYLRNIEEVIILTLADYGIRASRSAGETGVWMDPSLPGKERKICAIGVRSSRWITMHGFALNVNTDLSYFNHIIPCGIVNKQVTSIAKETGHPVLIDEIKEKIRMNFGKVFNAEMIEEPATAIS